MDYKLESPPYSCVHLVLHVSLLKKVIGEIRSQFKLFYHIVMKKSKSY
jgi:hypothetical protein